MSIFQGLINGIFFNQLCQERKDLVMPMQISDPLDLYVLYYVIPILFPSEICLISQQLVYSIVVCCILFSLTVYSNFSFNKNYINSCMYHVPTYRHGHPHPDSHSTIKVWIGVPMSVYYIVCMYCGSIYRFSATLAFEILAYFHYCQSVLK